MRLQVADRGQALWFLSAPGILDRIRRPGPAARPRPALLLLGHRGPPCALASASTIVAVRTAPRGARARNRARTGPPNGRAARRSARRAGSAATRREGGRWLPPPVPRGSRGR